MSPLNQLVERGARQPLACPSAGRVLEQRGAQGRRQRQRDEAGEHDGDHDGDGELLVERAGDPPARTRRG